MCVSYSRTHCYGINQQQAGVWEGDKFYTVLALHRLSHIFMVGISMFVNSCRADRRSSHSFYSNSHLSKMEGKTNFRVPSTAPSSWLFSRPTFLGFGGFHWRMILKLLNELYILRTSSPGLSLRSHYFNCLLSAQSSRVWAHLQIRRATVL